MSTAEIATYAEHAYQIDFVITLDIILKILLVSISVVLFGSFIIGKLLVFLNQEDKELDSFFYAKSVKMPSNKLYVITFLYIVTTFVYFTVGRSMMREYIAIVTENQYNYLDQIRPEVKFVKEILKINN
jgi:hypothetical protein